MSGDPNLPEWGGGFNSRQPQQQPPRRVHPAVKWGGLGCLGLIAIGLVLLIIGLTSPVLALAIVGLLVAAWKRPAWVTGFANHSRLGFLPGWMKATPWRFSIVTAAVGLPVLALTGALVYSAVLNPSPSATAGKAAATSATAAVTPSSTTRSTAAVAAVQAATAPTPTRVPPTPTVAPPTPTPNTAAAVAAYRKVVSDQASSLKLALVVVRIDLVSPGDVDNDATVRLKFFDALGTIRGTYTDAQKLAPPPGYSAFHQQYLAALKADDQAAALLGSAFNDNGGSTTPNQDQIGQAQQLIRRASDELDQALKSEPS